MSCFYIGDSIPGSNVTAASVLVVVPLFFIPLLEFALFHSPSDQCLRLVQSWSAMHRFYSNSLRCSWLTTGFHLTGRVYAHFLWCVLILFLPQRRRITITRLWFAHPAHACSHSNPESSSSLSHVFCLFSSFCFLLFSFQFRLSFFAQFCWCRSTRHVLWKLSLGCQISFWAIPLFLSSDSFSNVTVCLDSLLFRCYLYSVLY